MESAYNPRYLGGQSQVQTQQGQIVRTCLKGRKIILLEKFIGKLLLSTVVVVRSLKKLNLSLNFIIANKTYQLFFLKQQVTSFILEKVVFIPF